MDNGIEVYNCNGCIGEHPGPVIPISESRATMRRCEGYNEITIFRMEPATGRDWHS